MAANEPKPLPTVCGHRDAAGIIVQYSSDESGLLHTICGNCYRKGIYYVTRVEDIDLLLEGGISVSIEV